MEKEFSEGWKREDQENSRTREKPIHSRPGKETYPGRLSIGIKNESDKLTWNIWVYRGTFYTFIEDFTRNFKNTNFKRKQWSIRKIKHYTLLLMLIKCFSSSYVLENYTTFQTTNIFCLSFYSCCWDNIFSPRSTLNINAIRSEYNLRSWHTFQLIQVSSQRPAYWTNLRFLSCLDEPQMPCYSRNTKPNRPSATFLSVGCACYFYVTRSTPIFSIYLTPEASTVLQL